DGFPAFEACARIEVGAEAAGVKIRVALGASSLEAHVGLNRGATGSTLHLLTKRHHPRRTRTLTVTRRLRLLLLFRSLLARPIVFHVTTLTVLAFAHGLFASWFLLW